MRLARRTDLLPQMLVTAPMARAVDGEGTCRAAFDGIKGKVCGMHKWVCISVFHSGAPAWCKWGFQNDAHLKGILCIFHFAQKLIPDSFILPAFRNSAAPD